MERSIGLLKLRFPCLKYLRVRSPQYAANIVNACVTLHNLCINVEGTANDVDVIHQLGNPAIVNEDNLEDHAAVPTDRQERRREIMQLFNN